MKKIGYTTGVFDLFHIGHLNILKRARLECDHLIVGITTDELSESAKNKKPFIPFQERMDLVEAVKYVDEVCLLYTSPSPRDRTRSRMPSSA